jgi:hypothetical protein
VAHVQQAAMQPRFAEEVSKNIHAETYTESDEKT